MAERMVGAAHVSIRQENGRFSCTFRHQYMGGWYYPVVDIEPHEAAERAPDARLSSLYDAAAELAGEGVRHRVSEDPKNHRILGSLAKLIADGGGKVRRIR